MFFSISTILTVILPVAALHLILMPAGLLLLAPIGLKNKHYVLFNLMISLGIIIGPIGFFIWYAVKGKKIKAANNSLETERLQARAAAFLNPENSTVANSSQDENSPPRE